MYHSPSIKARLANLLVSYDQLVIPTSNLLILPVLRLWLGDEVFDSLVESRELVFARYDRWLGYVGNGGLISFQAGPNPDLPASPNLAMSSFAPLDEMIDTAIALTKPQSTDARRSALKHLLEDRIIQLPGERLVEKIKEESYADILQSPYLRALMSIRNEGQSLDRLRGSEPTKLVFCAPHETDYSTAAEITSVLRVGFENYILRMAGHVGTTEMTGDNATVSVLRGKGQRLGFSTQGEEAFVQMQRVSDVPDIGKAFAAGELSPSKLIELRRSKEAGALRSWFEGGAPGESSEEVLARYLETISKVAWLDRTPVKMARFALVAGWGVAEPASGIALAAIDNFFLNKWFGGRSPKLFMVKAKEALGSPKTALKAPTFGHKTLRRK